MNASSSVTVISVDPRVNSVGAQHPEAAARRVFRKVMPSCRHRSIGLRISLNMITGISRHTDNVVSGRMLLIRLMFAVTIASIVLFADFPAFDVMPRGVWLAVSGALTIGILYRPAALGGAAFFGFLFATALRGGVFDTVALLLSGISIVAAVAGPGRFSVDGLLRRAIFMMHNNSSRRKKIVDRRLSYKAYSELGV